LVASNLLASGNDPALGFQQALDLRKAVAAKETAAQRALRRQIIADAEQLHRKRPRDRACQQARTDNVERACLRVAPPHSLIAHVHARAREIIEEFRRRRSVSPNSMRRDLGKHSEIDNVTSVCLVGSAPCLSQHRASPM
jgi:hypothetical protein